jgi:[acyl-carrier-protein] S-malonyltransferase
LKTLGIDFKPEMVAGHSLGEFSALVCGTLSFEDGLKLVSQRAVAMQKHAKSNLQLWQLF